MREIAIESDSILIMNRVNYKNDLIWFNCKFKNRKDRQLLIWWFKLKQFFSIKFDVFSIKFNIFSIKFDSFSIKFNMFSIKFNMFSIKFSIFQIWCFFCNTKRNCPTCQNFYPWRDWVVQIDWIFLKEVFNSKAISSTGL